MWVKLMFYRAHFKWPGLKDNSDLNLNILILSPLKGKKYWRLEALGQLKLEHASRTPGGLLKYLLWGPTPRFWCLRSGVESETLYLQWVPTWYQCYWSRDLPLETIYPDLELKTFQCLNQPEVRKLHTAHSGISLQALIIHFFMGGQEGRQKRNLILKDVNAACKALPSQRKPRWHYWGRTITASLCSDLSGSNAITDLLVPRHCVDTFTHAVSFIPAATMMPFLLVVKLRFRS